jgi:hypothetical protein
MIEINATDRYKRLISTSPMQNLHFAASLLVDNRIHRLPLIDSNEVTGTEFVVSVTTQFRILKFIAANVRMISMMSLDRFSRRVPAVHRILVSRTTSHCATHTSRVTTRHL